MADQSEFEKSFLAWWEATKGFAAAAIGSVADAAQSAFGDNDAERVKLIMKLKGVDEETAKKLLAQYKAEQAGGEKEKEVDAGPKA